MSKLVIPYPDEQTIQQQCDLIVEKAASNHTAKGRFIPYLLEMYRSIGIRQLLSDKSELGMMLWLLLYAALYITGTHVRYKLSLEDMYCLIFLFSPISFLGLSLYSDAQKRWSETYEQEMTYKYSTVQISIFRMLLYSVIGNLANAALLGYMSFVHDDMNFLQSLMLSMTSLFLFSLLFLFVLMRSHSYILIALLSCGWIAGVVAVRILLGELFIKVVLSLPMYVYMFIFVAVVGLFFRTVRKMLLSSKGEV